MASRKLTAIDLYSGVGGWSLGMQLAGIKVVGSYEWWGPANETNFKNNRHQAQTVNIRTLSLDDLPAKVDIVVGSPPCTQFSFSNRGGGGDIAEGLEDFIKFLTVVDHLKPRYWAMENVPRVAKILEAELRDGGKLARFAHLGISHRVINMEEFGLPQRRKRCIAGNLDFDLLASYSTKCDRRTLGDVLRALAHETVNDPLYGIQLAAEDLFDHVLEEPLNSEEVRINRAAKQSHPVYNSMSFPDKKDRPVRTITATCTRVSRESVVVATAGGRYRRLSLRERACLQGFPITFQFYGKNHSEKLRMIGNAVPPAFTYFIGHAFRGTTVEAVPSLREASTKLKSPVPPPPVTAIESSGKRYSIERRFRFAIPSLRLKSGVRFELANRVDRSQMKWGVSFVFGTNKAIRDLRLDQPLLDLALSLLPKKLAATVSQHLSELRHQILDCDLANMQKLWAHRGPGATKPFDLLDLLDQSGQELQETLGASGHTCARIIEEALDSQFHGASGLEGLKKLYKHSPLIAAGIFVGTTANLAIAIKTKADRDARKRPQLRATN